MDRPKGARRSSMSCGSVGSAVRGFRLVNRQSAYGLRPTARELRPTARELRPKQPGVGRTQDKRPQGSQQAPSCMTSIRRWPGIATCLTIIRPFPAKLAPEGGTERLLFGLAARSTGKNRRYVMTLCPDPIAGTRAGKKSYTTPSRKPTPVSRQGGMLPSAYASH